MTEGLSRIDSAVAGLSISPKDEKVDKKAEKAEKAEKKTHRRASSAAEGVRNINDLGDFHGRWGVVSEKLIVYQKRSESPLKSTSKRKSWAGV
jgi:hypothetical protein